MWRTALIALVVAAVAVLLASRNTPRVAAAAAAPTEAEPAASLSARLQAANAVCYGADWCGFTRKQLTELEGEKGSFTYIDCEAEKERCAADGVNAFPTWIIHQKKHEGFMSKTRLAELCG